MAALPTFPGLQRRVPRCLTRVRKVAEHLTRVKVFLGHLLKEAPLYSPKAAVARQIGDGASASRRNEQGDV